jgi:hypothetical protein
MRRHCSHLIVLAVMLVGLSTARAADEMLTLACKGTTIAGYEGAKPEPLSMGIIVTWPFGNGPPHPQTRLGLSPLRGMECRRF